jgi:hypothetical protein
MYLQCCNSIAKKSVVSADLYVALKLLRVVDSHVLEVLVQPCTPFALKNKYEADPEVSGSQAQDVEAAYDLIKKSRGAQAL